MILQEKHLLDLTHMVRVIMWLETYG